MYLRKKRNNKENSKILVRKRKFLTSRSAQTKPNVIPWWMDAKVFFEIRVSRRSGRRRREKKKREEQRWYIETFILPVLNSRETINRGICHGTKRSRKSREIFEHLRYIIIFSFYAMILLSLYYCSFDTRLNKFMVLSIDGMYGTILKRSKQSSLFTCFSFLLKKFLP